jgi:hypothetical protein
MGCTPDTTPGYSLLQERTNAETKRQSGAVPNPTTSLIGFDCLHQPWCFPGIVPPTSATKSVSLTTQPHQLLLLTVALVIGGIMGIA